MNFSEYRQHDALGLAALIRHGEVSASELLDCALARCNDVNPQLNAVIIPMHDIARARVADELQGPFAGVPFLIKDIAQDHAGVASTAGSRAFRHHVPTSHSEYVNRALAAGLVIFGKTNTPELALKGTTEPEFWGPSAPCLPLLLRRSRQTTRRWCVAGSTDCAMAPRTPVRWCL